MKTLNEHTLVREFSVLARPWLRERRGLLTKHADYATAAIPDFDSCFIGSTVWMEFKHSKTLPGKSPKIIGPGLQLEMMRRRMYACGEAWYVVYEGRDEIARTVIVNPLDVDDDGLYSTTQWWVGADHAAVLAWLVGRHRARSTASTNLPGSVVAPLSVPRA